MYAFIHCEIRLFVMIFNPGGSQILNQCNICKLVLSRLKECSQGSSEMTVPISDEVLTSVNHILLLQTTLIHHLQLYLPLFTSASSFSLIIEHYPSLEAFVSQVYIYLIIHDCFQVRFSPIWSIVQFLFESRDYWRYNGNNKRIHAASAFDRAFDWASFSLLSVHFPFYHYKALSCSITRRR